METQSEKRSFQDIINGNKPVLVDFSAEWCGPCKMMPPILKELKGMTGDDVIILKMDVDKNPAIANAYQIQSVPTMIVFMNGQVKWRQSGVVNARALKSAIDQVTR
jgi:thioredoxin 1